MFYDGILKTFGLLQSFPSDLFLLRLFVPTKALHGLDIRGRPHRRDCGHIGSQSLHLKKGGGGGEE